MPSFFGFVLGILFVGVHVTAGGQTQPLATENGDVNGDGLRDISDAVGLLEWLFRGGSAPVAIADSPEIVARVDALEANQSELVRMLDEKLERIAVAVESLDESLQAIAESVGAKCEDMPMSERFIDNGDGTVTDVCARLMWQQLSSLTLTFDQAETEADQLELGEFTDWRMPTLDELLTLVVEGGSQATPPGIRALGSITWTSTPSPLGPNDTEERYYTVSFRGANSDGTQLAVRRASNRAGAQELLLAVRDLDE